ncbi:MAG: amidohydrolase family protein [Pseudomonadota bacterium]
MTTPRRMRLIVWTLAMLAAAPACRRTAAHTLPDGGYDRGPVIDSHTLITQLDGPIDVTLALHDRVGVVKFCNKNGGAPGTRAFEATLHIKKRLGDRFAFFSNLSWRGVTSPGWGEREAERLELAVRVGAKGIKIFKALGLGVRDDNGRLLTVDDPRLDPLFERAAQLNAIVALHTGDPKAFFEPVTPQNERYDELKQAPDWSFYGGDFPTRDELLAARDRVLAKHPKTTFLLIHLANNPEDLDYVASVLDRFPNVYVDTSARVPEFGRHPADKVRAFFVRYQDRILFGTDLAISPYGMQLGSVSEKPPTFDDAVKFYLAHFRYFETDLKQMDHPTPIQGRWKVDGIALPHEVLRKLYYDNAEKLIFERVVTVPVVDPFVEAPASQPAPAPATTPTRVPASQPAATP